MYPGLDTVSLSRRRAIQLPAIDYHIPSPSRENPDRNDVVHPIVLLAPSFKYHPQMQMTICLSRAARLDEDVRPVVCLQVVARVCVESAVLINQTPVRTKI